MRDAQGLGRALLARFVDDALRVGAEQMFLEVRVANCAGDRAVRVGEGFAPVARRANYYPPAPRAPREDALVMRRDVAARRAGCARERDGAEATS